MGKTHLAIRLGVVTAELGHRVYFTTAIEMARKLSKAMTENRLSRELKNLTRPKLLIADEVGYLSLEPAEASLVFQVISQRYERQGAVIVDEQQSVRRVGRSLRRRRRDGLCRLGSTAASLHGRQHPRRELSAQREASRRAERVCGRSGGHCCG